MLNTYATRGEPPTNGQLFVGLVLLSMMILWSVVLLANVGGHRDRFVRRTLMERSVFSPDPASAFTPQRIKSTTRSLMFVVTVVLLGQIFFFVLALAQLAG